MVAAVAVVVAEAEAAGGGGISLLGKVDAHRLQLLLDHLRLLRELESHDREQHIHGHRRRDGDQGVAASNLFVPGDEGRLVDGVLQRLDGSGRFSGNRIFGIFAHATPLKDPREKIVRRTDGNIGSASEN